MLNATHRFGQIAVLSTSKPTPDVFIGLIENAV